MAATNFLRCSHVVSAQRGRLRQRASARVSAAFGELEQFRSRTFFGFAVGDLLQAANSGQIFSDQSAGWSPPHGGLVRESTQNVLKSGLGYIVICPANCDSSY